MEQVEIGVMLPGAVPFNDQNVNPTWKAHVKTHSGVIVAYVKRVTPRQLYVECVCALIGRLLELPIPKPVIVKVTSQNFPEIPEGQFALAFGSEDAGYPSFRRYAQSIEAMDKLDKFVKTIDVGVFDEWIANWDRNVGNILYDGGEAFSFIDHENAISDAVGHDEAAEMNQIVDVLYSVKTEFEKYKLKREVQSSVIPQYSELALSLISDKSYAASYLSDDEIMKVITFLEKRTTSLGDLFSRRLNLKQQEMAV